MNDDWLKTQRKYWEEWTDLSFKALGLNPTESDAWEGAMDHWWQAMEPAAPDMAKDFMGKMMEQGKMFFRMADTFTRDTSKTQGTGLDGWQILSRSLEDMQKAFTGGYEEGDDALHKMLAFWELPYDNWQRTMSSLSPIPGDLLRNMPHEHVKEGVQRFLSAPGLGYTREEQSQYQDLIRRTIDYQRALQEYTGFFSHIGIKSVDRMRETLQGLRGEDKTIDSARGLYDTWVSCCEEVYAEEVHTADYARVHGQLVNAQMALKQRMGVMVDEALGVMNMPTRSELRTLQDRLQETRRETKALRHELNALTKRIAKGPVNAGTAQVSATPSGATPAPTATPGSTTATAAPRKKPAVRKKAAARKKAVQRPTGS